MKTAVMYGAGNIGRGFIGALLSQSGYEVVFIDVVKDVVERLNADRAYTVRLVSGEGHEDQRVEHVRAVDGNDKEAVAEAIARCELMATSVGARVLGFIAPNIAAGVKRRLALGNGPLNLLICENLMDADHYIRNLLAPHLSAEELAQVGLIETSIGRMVPIQTEEMRQGDPLRVCVERYGYLPVDQDAFLGPIPSLRGILPSSPFHFYLERKLYLHNMGHAICAYLGFYTGRETIDQSIADSAIRLIVSGAMRESALRLAEKYQTAPSPLFAHADDLLYRFGNAALGLTCARVGADIPRKLALNDRLVGAALSAYESGRLPLYICAGIAAALRQYLAETNAPQTQADAAKALGDLAGLDPVHPVFCCALSLYETLAEGKPLSALQAAIDGQLHAANPDVV